MIRCYCSRWDRRANLAGQFPALPFRPIVAVGSDDFINLGQLFAGAGGQIQEQNLFRADLTPTGNLIRKDHFANLKPHFFGGSNRLSQSLCDVGSRC